MLLNIFRASLLLAIFVSGCTYSKKSPDEVKAEAFDEVSRKMRDSTLDIRNAAMTASDFTVTFEAGREPNQYTLIVTASRVVPKMVMNISGLPHEEVSGSNRISKSMLPLRARDKDYIDIEISTFNNDRILASKINLGQHPIPRDFVFSEDTTLTNDTNLEYADEDRQVRKYHKIIFNEGVSLNLRGHNLNLETNEIVFMGKNEIYAHTKYRSQNIVKAAIIDGADLTIKAKKSVGFVVLKMIGQPGKDGLSTLHQAYDILKGNITVAAERGKNGRDSELKDVSRFIPGHPMEEVQTKVLCLAQPTNGEDGADGIVLHGTDGTRGGDTGNLVIDIEDYSQSKFTIFFIPGKGGRGGEANFHGQKGGKGGLAGRSAKPCRQAQNGKDGRDSTLADSRPGNDGPDGAVGKLIVPHIPNHFQVFTDLTLEGK